jgi:site-specific DNA recombinase
MRAAVYQRLSASGRGDEAPGLDRQREACLRLVRERGWTLAGSFHDADTSAFRPGVPRPGWAELVAAVEAGEVDAVVVWKMDRAFRRIKEGVDFLDLCQRRGIAFVSVTEGIDSTTPFGPVLFALFASLAALESKTKSDRIRAWHDQRAQAGLPVGGGGRPFGFHPGGINHHPAETRLIRQAVRGLIAGTTNFTRIAREWSEAGVRTTVGGKRWSKSSVRRIVLSPRIAGLREHGEDVYPAAWKGIISEDDHLRLRTMFSEKGQPAARRYVLAGIAICGLCGGPLHARPKVDGRRCYVCAIDHGGCGKIRTLAAPVEQLVARMVDEFYSDHAQPATGEREKRQAELRAQLAADEQALDELARDRYVTRSISTPEFVAAREPLVTRIADAQEAIQAAVVPQTWEQFKADILEAPWELPPGTDPDPDDFAYWRRWIGEAVEAVVIGPAVKGRNFFDPSRVSITWR